MVYVIKCLHHPNPLLPSNNNLITEYKCYKLYLDVHKTYIQCLVEYNGDPEYDVTPHNWWTYIITAIPSRTVPLKVAIELVKKALNYTWNDTITHLLFDDNGKIKARLMIKVALFTFDKLDPRDIKNWDQLYNEVRSIDLHIFKKNSNEWNSVRTELIWLARELINGNFEQYLGNDDTWIPDNITPRTIKGAENLRPYIEILDILTDDLTTYILRRRLTERIKDDHGIIISDLIDIELGEVMIF